MNSNNLHCVCVISQRLFADGACSTPLYFDVYKTKAIVFPFHWTIPPHPHINVIIQ